MTAYKPYILGGIAIAIIVFVFVVLTGSEKPTLEGGQTKNEAKKEADAPAFSLQDYEGNTVSSKDFKGKLLVVNAWASWCPFCVNELPEFKLLQEAFPDEIVVVAINRAEPSSTAKDFSDKLELTDSYVFLVDPEDSFYKSIGGFSMPETIFISKKGKLLQHKRGPFAFLEMKSIVENLLSEQ